MKTRLKEVDWFKNNLEKNKLSQVWNTTLFSKRNALNYDFKIKFYLFSLDKRILMNDDKLNECQIW